MANWKIVCWSNGWTGPYDSSDGFEYIGAACSDEYLKERAAQMRALAASDWPAQANDANSELAALYECGGVRKALREF